MQLKVTCEGNLSSAVKPSKLVHILYE